jgi:D-sedoheptulose 7-phosphate isomerase
VYDSAKNDELMKTAIRQRLIEARQRLDGFLNDERQIAAIDRFSERLADTLSAGGKAFSCGNGGSMCDAMHFAEELTGRFHDDRPALAAIAIADPSHLTCTANDFGFDQVFSRYLEGLGRPGDLLLGLSTSGNSPNIIRAVETARQLGMFSVALLGRDGGRLRSMADLAIVVPADTSDRIQEIHIKIIHIVIETVEKRLFPDPTSAPTDR